MTYYNHNNNKYLQLYNNWLPFFFTASSVVGVFTGLITALNGELKEVFPNIIGYASIGVITGITYPVSIPLFGGYVLYKGRK